MPFWVPSKVTTVGAIEGRRATVLHHPCLFVVLDVLNHVADIISATTLSGKVVGQLIKLVSTRKSIGVVIEEIESLVFMSRGRSVWLLQDKTRSDRTAENRYQSPFALERGFAPRMVSHARKNIAEIVKVRLALAHLAMSTSECSVDRTELKV